MLKLIKYMYLCLYICVLLFFLMVNLFNIFKYFFFKYLMYMFILFFMIILNMIVINKKDFYCIVLLIKEDV